MLKASVLCFLLVASALSFAQLEIPNGTMLPVKLRTSLNSSGTNKGASLTAAVQQDIPLPNGSRIPKGTKLTGQVTDVIPASPTQGAQLSFRIDSIELHRRRVAVSASLRAVGSALEVDQAQVPKSGPDRGTSANNWTTVQIGGDVVYRGGGPVTGGEGQVVGEPVPNGVLVWIAARPGSKCSGELSPDPQALWLFSADACGIYGLPGLSISHAGKTPPVGQITIESKRGNVRLRSGSGLLLRVRRDGQ
jgi:hypothetical protein